MNKLLPFLVVSLFFLSLIPIGSGTATIYVGDYFYVGNETYGVTHTMIFQYIQVESSWIKFNTTDFNVTSANNIYINLSFLHEDISMATSGEEVLDFVANSTAPSVGFSIGSFTPSVSYVVKRNDTQIATPTANGAGFIYFTNNVWTHKHFEIYVTTSVSPPDITLNFAGNLSDSGGPYLRPPGYLPMHTIPLAGVWSDGYYTNDSWQQEDWIYINTTITDAEGVANVWLQWYNQTSNAWTNYTYAFANTVGNYWDYNTSGNILVSSGHNYSFNIVANDTIGNQADYYWRKSGLSLSDTRRYVQLNCTPVNISYKPYYFYDVAYSGLALDDIMRHDQGTDLGFYDSGYLLGGIPSDTVEERHCGSYLGFYFDNETCPEPFTLENIYHHVWLSTDDAVASAVGWYRSREELTPDTIDSFSFPETDGKSRIYYDQGEVMSDNNYDLVAKKQVITSESFTDNDIYEFSWKLYDSSGCPSVVNNRSFTSFIIFNVPSNTTLLGLDTDSDGLKDWEELYTTFTNPWVNDTDNDGLSDYFESINGLDPNDYLDFNVTKINITRPPINGTTEDPYVELYGYCSMGLDSTNFSADVFADVYSPTGWTVGHVYMKFYTNNSILDQNITATSYTQVNSTYRRYTYEYNPSNTLSGLDMGPFDVNVSVSAYNLTHIYNNYTFFSDVFEVYKLTPPTNISSIYSSTTNTINLSWSASSENYSIFRPNAVGDLSELHNFGAANNWQCVDETPHDGATTCVYQDETYWRDDLYNLQDHTTETDNITRVTVNAVFGSSTGSSSATYGLKTGGTIYDAGFFVPYEPWTNYSISWDVNPKTSVAWSWGDIDDLQVFVSLHRASGTNVSCTQIYIIVDYEQEEVIADSATDSIVVVRNNNTYPVCPTDGYEVQNSTAGYYNTSVTFDEAYFSLFAYNDTTKSYSEYIKMEWGVLGLNCFNESNPSQAIGFDIEISNSDATDTYTASDLTNTHYIDINDIPYGDDTIFVISNSSYRQRIYYYDLALNKFYNKSFYLPLISVPVDPGSGDDGGNTTTTKLYRLRVIDEYSYPIAGAEVDIRRYINTTDSYNPVTIVTTDGYGEADVWLIPAPTLYKVFINKDGFDESIDDWIPDPIFYGADYPKIFQISRAINDTQFYTFWEIINFNATMYDNNTIKVMFYDTLDETTDAQFYTYEVFNFTESLNSTDTTSSNIFSFWVTGINTSREHRIVLHLNHTTLGYEIQSIMLEPIYDGPVYDKAAINIIVTNVWGNFIFDFVHMFFMYIPALICLVIFRKENPGIGVISSGLWIGFAGIFLLVPPETYLLAPFIVALGFILIIVKGGKNKL